LAAKAFFGLNLTNAVISQGIDCIQSKTFGDCAQLQTVTIPPTVGWLVDDAFEGCSGDLIIICEEGSKAHEFAVDKGYDVQFITPTVHP